MSFALPEREAHHAAQVLRLGVGDEVTVLDGAGQTLTCKIETISRKSIGVTVVNKTFTPPPPCKITLVQAIPKGKMFEWIIEKAVELGVTQIVPLVTERTVVQFDQARGAEKQQRWQQTAIEAIKQCGQAWLPEVTEPVSVSKFLGNKPNYDLSLVGSLHSGAQHPRQFFDEFARNHRRPPSTIAIFIGPEGDFSANEIQAIQDGGAKPITLGPLVLRCETAAVYCLSITNYELQAMQSLT